jgi:hypothetical protein
MNEFLEWSFLFLLETLIAILIATPIAFYIADLLEHFGFF